MKKHIEIPEVKGVYVAAVREKNEEFRSLDWNTYIINDKNVSLDMVLIVARGYDDKDTTSIMRHSLKVLPAKSFAKIEFIQDEVLRLNNEFQISFFEENRIYEKKFLFKKNSIKESAAGPLPVIPSAGVLAE